MVKSSWNLSVSVSMKIYQAIPELKYGDRQTDTTRHMCSFRVHYVKDA